MFHAVIIDDEHWIVSFIKGLVPWKRIGVEVAGTAADGQEGLDLCLRLRPDIALTDIRMPNADGLAMIARIKETLPDLETIIISGYDDFEYARTALRHGASDYLLKPINANELVRALERAKRRIESRREAKRRIARIERKVHRLAHTATGTDKTALPLSVSISDNRILAAIAFIEREYQGNISEIDVAEHVGMSVSHFSELFKEEVGKNFVVYLRDLRMHKAQDLLESTLLRVGEIAEMVGYQNPNYFSRVFKQCTGRRASDYRSPIATPDPKGEPNAANGRDSSMLLSPQRDS